MKTKIILSAALVLAGATGAFAQTMQYDRTGDHMYSFGAQTVSAPAKTHAAHHAAPAGAPAPLSMVPQVQYDRTGDHMNSYGPVAQ
jgi:hypothetical protein